MVVNMFQQLLFLIIIIMNAGMSLPCAPGEVNQPHIFTANVTAKLPVLWKRDDADIFLCSTLNVCTQQAAVEDEYKNLYEATRSVQITTLKIITVTTQSGGSYACHGGSEFNCDFKVYAKPDSVTCQDPEFRAVTQDVAVVCTVQRIYPNPVCRFSWFIDNTEIRIIQKNWIQYNNLTGSGSPSYFNQNCSFSLPAQNFTPGKHQFQLTAYPDVTGQDSDVFYGKNSTPASLQSVFNPVATLNCSGTTVQEGQQVSCTCTETNNTFILATTTLFYGAANVSSALQHITAPITVNRYTSEIICQAQLPEGTKTNKTHSINVYYGPSSVSVRVFDNQTKNDVISLCGQSVTVTVTCNVPVNDVSPGVNYQYSSNVTAAHVVLPNMTVVNYTVTSGGVFYFLCTGKNTYNSSLSASAEKITQVSEPPKQPPVIAKHLDGGTSVIVAPDNGQLTVEEGLARIICQVDGGYPPVSGLLLECSSQTNTSEDNNIYIDVNITRHMHGSICSCTATHSSSCHRNNMSQAVLDVQFAPTIFSFDVNSTSEQIVERNSTVSFTCQAEGNPSPSLSLRKNGTELHHFKDPTHNFNLTLAYNMAMSKCLDTGVYMCRAGDGQTTTSKTVTVYVKCMQNFTNPDNLKQTFAQQVNGTVSINVSVFGYPEPNVTLNSYKYAISSDAYNLTYIKQESPFGTVSLMINIENASFFQNYSLNINNTEGELTYSFEIVKGDSETSGPKMSSPSGQDVGAIVGGIVAAVLVIVIICVIIFLLKRKGAPCKRKEHPYANTSRNGLNKSDESVNAAARKGTTDSGDKEVTVDNTLLYDMGRKSQEVEIDNIIYNMDNTVEIDNSDLYNRGRSDFVEIDNSDLYNMNRPELGNPNRESEYKKYSEITPTIKSATSMPLNMRNQTEDANPYEDVSSENKNKPKPPAPQKPKPTAKPKPQPGKQDGQKAKTVARDQTYATVVKVPKSDKPFAIKEDKEEFFVDPSLQPEVPDKNFENPYEDTVNEQSDEKKSSDVKNNKDKRNGKASKEHKDPSSLAYTNNGFSNQEGEVTV